MRRKLRLLGKAVKAGWRWALATTDHLSRAITVLVLLGAGTFSAVQVGWWGPVVAVAVFVLIAFFAGGLEEWDRAAKYIEVHGRYLQAMEKLRAECFEHVVAVERFLRARELKGPPEPSHYFSRALKGGAEQQAVESEASQVARHGRTTAGEFIDSDHLAQGVDLFNRLVRSGLVVEGNRPFIEEPKSPENIWEGIRTIEAAAERVPVIR